MAQSGKTPPQTIPKLFNLLYEAKPRPYNVATPLTTRIYADTPQHPLHIRAHRRLAAVDLGKLHISVTAAKSLSKKALIRGAAVNKVKNCLRQELERQGWRWDGTASRETHLEGDKGRDFDLTGAYRVALLPDPIVLTSTLDTVRECCSQLVRKMVHNSSRVKGPAKDQRQSFDRKPSALRHDPFQHLDSLTP